MVHPLSELPIAAPQKKLVVEVCVLIFHGVLVHEKHIRSLGLIQKKPGMNAASATFLIDRSEGRKSTNSPRACAT